MRPGETTHSPHLKLTEAGPGADPALLIRRSRASDTFDVYEGAASETSR